MGDYIELRDEGGWPVDERFYRQDVWDGFDLVADRLRAVGLDPSLALEKSANGDLLAWLFSFENNSTGGPWVGHAVVSRVGTSDGCLELVEVVPNLPVTVGVDLAYFACHAAAVSGGSTIQTALETEELSLVGSDPAPTDCVISTPTSWTRTQTVLERCSVLMCHVEADGETTETEPAVTCPTLALVVSSFA